MGTPLIDNFAMYGKSFVDKRQKVSTLHELKNIVETTIPDGFLCYCEETLTWYQYNFSNAFDDTTGKWRVFRTELTAISDAEMDALFEEVGL